MSFFVFIILALHRLHYASPELGSFTRFTVGRECRERSASGQKDLQYSTAYRKIQPTALYKIQDSVEYPSFIYVGLFVHCSEVKNLYLLFLVLILEDSH